MATPLPPDHQALLTAPDEVEVAHLARGVVSAVAGPGGLSELQALVLGAQFEALTGHSIDLAALEPIEPEEFAAGMARRNLAFRSRIVQQMLLGELILAPIPPEVSDRVTRFANALSVTDDLLGFTRRLSEGSLGLAAVDFDRNGYSADWDPMLAEERLGVAKPLADAWEQSVDDPALAARWASLGDLPDGTLGNGVWRLYRARGFEFPGSPGSAPPLLAQHDWVHVLADFGTTLENELEVFGYIARANDDPRGFSLLAMVVSLFETGHLATAAGLFEADTGHLSTRGMATRLADASLRGALTTGSNDFMALDWFAIADRPLDVVRAEFGIPPKSAAAVAAGSVSAWEPGGISPFQLRAGMAAAERDGRPYEAFGATVDGGPGR
ncbi:MAG: hypothetical protein AAF531_18165 [Actinomycetota bacterium]